MKHMIVTPLTIATLFAAPFVAQAATIRVPQDQATIQAAIDAAVSGDVVRVAAGTYGENLVIQGKALSIIGAGATSTIVDGNAAGRVFTISDVTTGQVVLAGLTLRNGLAYGGGAINASSANLTVRDSILTANQACGALALRFEFGTLRLLRNRIQSNVATEPGCSNEAVDAFVGGANYFDHNVFADNPVSALRAYSDEGTMYFRHNVFRNNVEFGGSLQSAGGLVATGDLIVESNLFANNSGAQNGGAYLLQQEQGQGRIRNNSFSGNDGAQSAALAIEATTGTNLEVSNNLLSDDREFVPEIFCGRSPITIAHSNVFASDVSSQIAGTCVRP